ncbi:hypothetical protein [Bradyrhizobium sp. McL0615]|uniref:hypothetical protein n=1 Tax=Bradyrhizobium sp. McL0615 TaxID=3415673 RepID=UPI003CF9B72C
MSKNQCNPGRLVLSSVLAAIVALTTSASAQNKPQASSLKTCAMQLTGEIVTDDNSAANIIGTFGQQALHGETRLNALERGHHLYCLDDQGTWRAIGANTNPADTRELELVRATMARVDDAAKVLGIEKELKAMTKRHGLGGGPALVSIGPMKPATQPGMFAAFYNLFVLNVDKAAVDAATVDVAVHEALGHYMFYMSCNAAKGAGCRANPLTAVWSIAEEADAYAKHIAYAVYLREAKQQAVAHVTQALRAYDKKRYIDIADDLLRTRPEFAATMRADGAVPREYTALLFEQFMLRPLPHYLRVAAGRQRPFGTDKDIAGSIDSATGYLEDSDRKRIVDAFRNSSLYGALKGQEKLSMGSVERLLANTNEALK